MDKFETQLRQDIAAVLVKGGCITHPQRGVVRFDTSRVGGVNDVVFNYKVNKGTVTRTQFDDDLGAVYITTTMEFPSSTVYTAKELFAKIRTILDALTRQRVYDDIPF